MGMNGGCSLYGRVTGSGSILGVGGRTFCLTKGRTSMSRSRVTDRAGINVRHSPFSFAVQIMHQRFVDPILTLLAGRNNFLDITPEDPIPGVDLYKNTHMPWTKRSDSTKYDFRERRYRKPKGRNDPFWSDATWPRRGADHYKQPLNYRCEHGEWFNLTWSPFGGMPLEGYNGVRLRDRGIFA